MSRSEEIRNIICDAELGYDLIAPFYDSWHWQKFWGENELPKLVIWMRSLKVGYGADFGAGSGNSLLPFLKSGHRVDAFDISNRMLSLCVEKHLTYVITGRLKYYCMDVRKIWIKQRRYDWIICNRMLSNNQSVSDVARVMSKVIKRGGQCFISDILPEHHYDNTHLRIGNLNINIETYKHPIAEVVNCFVKHGFKVLFKHEYRKYNVRNSSLLDKYMMYEPIYYVLILKYGE